MHDSRITATDGADRNVGIHRFIDHASGIFLTETLLLASGGRTAHALSVSDEDGGATVTGGTIMAVAEERALGIAGGESGSDLQVFRVRIVATSSGEAVGIGWTGAGASQVIVDDSFVHSSGVAVSRFIETTDAPFDTLDVLRSQLIGATRGIEIPHGVLLARIDGSVIQGGEWATNAGQADEFTIYDSILDGTATIPGATATCTNVLDGDYQPLGSDCLPE